MLEVLVDLLDRVVGEGLHFLFVTLAVVLGHAVGLFQSVHGVAADVTHVHAAFFG